jgi:alpha/beta superfamily hydrolase
MDCYVEGTGAKTAAATIIDGTDHFFTDKTSELVEAVNMVVRAIQPVTT